MSYYKPGTHIKLNRKEALSNKIFKYSTAVFATYGIIELVLKLNQQ